MHKAENGEKAEEITGDILSTVLDPVLTTRTMGQEAVLPWVKLQDHHTETEIMPQVLDSTQEDQVHSTLKTDQASKEDTEAKETR